MADDRIHPSTATAPKPTFPPSKAQLYNPTRPLYRPQPPPRRRRGRCCSFCLCLLFLLIALVLLAAVAAAVFYLIYKPHPPSFSVRHLNLTSSSLSLSLTARNSNSKLAFVYDPISVSVSSAGSPVADGEFTGFEHKPGNVTVLKTTLGVKTEETKVMKGKKSVMGDIQVETKAGVRVGGVKSKKVGIRVRCDGVELMGKKEEEDVKCKVRVKVKVWKWNL